MSDNGNDHRDASAGSTSPAHTACVTCGSTVPGAPPPTWVYSVEGGVDRYLCDRCARENIRSIEGRLDTAWW